MMRMLGGIVEVCWVLVTSVRTSWESHIYTGLPGEQSCRCAGPLS